MFLKKWVLQKHEFSYPFFQSISYNNMAVTKQIYFSPTFLKWWVLICDNIAGVVGGSQYYQKGNTYKEGEGYLLPCPIII